MRTKGNIDKIIATLLKNRGIKTAKQKKEFFNPPRPEKVSARSLGINDSQLKKAVKRIKEAIKKKEKVIVYGDYDVDGICATAILWETLDALGADAMPYIPSRFTEGYGLNIESIKKLKEDDPKLGLIITVDHGIVAYEKVDFANEIGVDVIIVDHHEPGVTRPRAYAVVHTQKICGSAVAWVVARGLDKWTNRQIENRQKPTYPLIHSSTYLTDHLGLVALGTVADVLPLTGINRSFVVHGLEVLRKTTRPGIRALCGEASIEQSEIDTFHINFILAPRLNAMGRVEHALDSLRLLCTRDKTRAEELAAKLGRTNRLRQEKTDYAVNHVNEKFAPAWANGSLPKLIFVHHESYEEGIIGIVAGRLVDQYHRPSIVVSQGQEFSKASARSIRGINIIETIRKAGGKLLVNAGGHPMAAGFTVETESLEILSKRLSKLAEREIKDEVLVKNTRVDCELSFSEISEEFYNELVKFAPFGHGNPEPTFLTRGVIVQDARLVGKDKSHLKLVLAQSSTLDAIGFRMGEIYPSLSQDLPVDIVYSIKVDEWDGNRKLQLGLKELKIPN